jgi:gamma-glutamylcyclotransferase (GGCT)/AIG2-like uncharacterized protein YtfP
LNSYLFTYGYLQSKYQKIKKAPTFNFRSLGSGTYRGLLYEVDDYPGVVFTGKKENIVYGEILEINDLSDLVILDRYERALPTVTEHPEYRRNSRLVYMVGGDPFHCWVYEYLLDIQSLKKITDGKY